MAALSWTRPRVCRTGIMAHMWALPTQLARVARADLASRGMPWRLLPCSLAGRGGAPGPALLSTGGSGRQYAGAQPRGGFCGVRAVNGNGNGNGANGMGAPDWGQMPKELEGLAINSEGLLIDEKTGAVINEFGATRFDIAVHAIRGEFDPPAGVDNTENSTGLLLGSLKSFPLDYTFTIVARQSEGTSSLLEDVRQTISRVCGSDVSPENCRASERLKGKFLSLRVIARVPAPAIIDRVFQELSKDPRIMMRY